GRAERSFSIISWAETCGQALAARHWGRSTGMIQLSDRRQSAFLLFMVLAVVSAGNNALASVLPTIGRQLGIGDVLIALVFSLSALLWSVSSPFWARQSDRHGRKKLILVGVSGFMVSGLAFGLVVLAGLHGW